MATAGRNYRFGALAMCSPHTTWAPEQQVARRGLAAGHPAEKRRLRRSALPPGTNLTMPSPPCTIVLLGSILLRMLLELCPRSAGVAATVSGIIINLRAQSQNFNRDYFNDLLTWLWLVRGGMGGCLASVRIW
jgi:hypothetical protein